MLNWSWKSANRKNRTQARKDRRKASRLPLRLELLEDRTAPAVVTYTSATQALVFDADAGEFDDVTVSVPAAGQLQIVVGNGDAITLAGDAAGNPAFVLSMSVNADDTLTIDTGAAAVAAFTVNTGDGNDTLVVDFGGGNPVPAGGLFYNGADPTVSPGDSLGVSGDGTNIATYRPDAATPGNGTIDVDGGLITFTGLEPVDISNMADANVMFPNADDDITLTNGTDFTKGGGTAALVVSGTSGGVAFEQAALFDNGTVIVRTTDVDGTDTVTIVAATAGNNINLDIETGFNGDTVNINGPVTFAGLVDIQGGTINVNNTITGGTPVVLTALGGAITDGNGAAVNVVAPGLNANAETGIDLDTTVDTLFAVNFGPGNVTLDEADGAQANLVLADNGDVTVTTATGDLAVVSVSASGTASLSALAGAIVDDNGATDNVTATSLALIAATGIGVGDALETVVANLEAQTDTGGIFLSNTGDLNIGGVTGALSGVRVTTDGAIEISAASDIVITTPGDAVSAPGDITLTASDDILTGGNQIAVDSTGGTVTLNAGQDLLLGDLANNAFGDVRGGGSIVLDAGRDIIVDVFTFVDAHGAGTVTATAGRDISLLPSNGSGAHITSEGGDINLTATAGSVTIVSVGGGGVRADGGTGGDITINAAGNIQTGGNSTSIFTMGTGLIDLTAGLNILLGDAANNAFGDVQGGSINLNAGGDIIVDVFTFLDAHGDGTVTANAGGDIAILQTNANPTARITSEGGAISLTAGGTFTADGGGIGVDSSHFVAAGGDITITATDITLADPVNAGTGNVALIATAGAITDTTPGANRVTGTNLEATAVTGITLETQVANVEAQTDTGGISLDNVGDLNIGGVTPALSGVRVLVDGAIVINAASSIIITTPGDAVSAPGDVTLTATEDILTGGNQTAVESTGGTVTLNAGQDLLLGDVANGAFGNVLGGGSVVLNAGRNLIVDVETAVDARGVGGVTATAGQDISVLQSNGLGGARISSEGGDISLTATTGNVTVVSGAGLINSGGVIASLLGGSGNVTVTAAGNIQTGGDTTAFSTLSPGTVDLNAGLNIFLGDAVTNTFGDVVGGNVNVTAGGDLVLDVGSFLDATDAGTVTVNVGGSIAIQQSNGTTGARITSESGAISVTAGGTFTADGGGDGVDSTRNITPGADITISAIDITLADPITAGVGNVSLTATFGAITDTTPGVNRVGGNDLTASAIFGITLETVVTTIDAQTVIGDVDIDEADGATVVNAITGGGNVDVNTAAGDFTIVNVSATGTATLTAQAGSILDDNDNSTLVTATDLVMNADVAIGQPGPVQQIDTAVNTVTAVTTNVGAGLVPGIWIGDADDLTVIDATATNGFVVLDAGGNMDVVNAVAGGIGSMRLRALGGDLTVGFVSAANTVNLFAAGAITDGADPDDDIVATSLSLRAGTGIGPMETAVSNLAYDSGVGDITLANTGALTITTVAFIDVVTGGTGDGAATISAASPLTVGADVTMGGDITLDALETADFPLCEDDLTVSAGVTVESAGGNVTLRAGDDLIIEIGANIFAAGTVELTAAFGDLDGCGALINNGTIVAGTVNECAADDLVVGFITASGTVTLRSLNGQIVDGNGVGLNVMAPNLAMQANTGIGTGVDGALETQVDNVEALTETGGIFLSNTGDLSVGGVTPTGCGIVDLPGVRVNVAGDIQLDVDGSVFVTVTGDTVQAPGNVTVNATVNIEASGFNGDPAAAFHSTGGTTTLNAGQDIILGQPGFDFGDVVGNSVDLIAGRDIIVQGGSFVLARGTGNVTANAGGNISLSDAAIIAAETGTVTLTALGDFTTADGTFVDTTFFFGNAGNDITITAANVFLGGQVSAGAGDVFLTATTGEILDTNLPNAQDVFGDELFAFAVTGITLDTSVNTIVAATSGTGPIFLDEADEVNLLDVTSADGPITVLGGNDTIATNVVSLTDDDANDISITAAIGNLDVITVMAGAGAAADVTLEATIGSILDDGDNNTLVTGDEVTLTAAVAVGQPGPVAQIDTAANTLVVATTGPGPFVPPPVPGIWVGDVDDLTIQSATTADGFIVIDAAGNLDAQLVDAGGAGRSVRLRALGGDLAVGSVSADNVVNLFAAGAITDGDPDIDVTATGLIAQAGTGIGAPGDPLETAVSNLAYNSGTGPIFLTNFGGLTITTVSFIDTVVGGFGAGGRIEAASPLTISANVTTTADMSFATFDAGLGDDITIHNGAVVTVDSATNVTLSFEAGDSMIFDTGSVVTQGGGTHTVLITTDTEGFLADDTQGRVDQTDATVSVTADILDIVNAPNGVGTAALPFRFSTGDFSSNSAGNTGNQFLDAVTPTLVTRIDAGLGQLVPDVRGHVTLVNGFFLLENGDALADPSAIVVNLEAIVLLNPAGETVGSLAGDGEVDFGDATLTEGFNDLSTTFSGTLGNVGDTGGLTKIGLGTFTLDAAGTYNFLGEINVNGGTLIVNGVIASSGELANVNDTATLGGTGVVGRNLAANFGGTVSPGDPTDSPGLLTTGDTSNTFEFGSTFFVNLNGLIAGTQYDQLAAIGTVAINDATLAGALGFGVPFGGQFVIIDNDGTDDVTGTFAGAPEGGLVNVGGVNFLITYQGGDGNDVVLTLPGRFDFNRQLPPPPSPTAAGFIGVFPSNIKTTPGVGPAFGWVLTPGAFDRGVPNDLLRDGHFGRDNAFIVDLAMPGTYRVSLIIGDAQVRHDRIEVSLNGVVQPGLISALPGQFVTANFVVDVAGTSLTIRLRDTGGSDPNFAINALTILPDSEGSSSVGELTIVRIFPDPGVVPDPLFADGLSVDTYQGTGASANALITVATTAGTIVTADASPFFAGIQVIADATGTFFFDLRRPTGTGSALLTADEVTGLSHGEFLQTYQLPTERHIDFNASSNPNATQPGFLGIVPFLYTSTATNALGWQSGPAQSADRGVPNLLLRDFHFNQINTFLVDLPNGDYDVTVRMGDAIKGHDKIDILVGGSSVLGGNLINTPSGQFVTRSFQVTVTNGQLALQFRDRGGSDPNFVINALDIRPADAIGVITLFSPGDPLQADGMTVDTYTGTGATPGSLVTVATTLGTVVSADASPIFAGIQVMADAGGNIAFDIRRPSGIGSGALITAEEVDGLNQGELAQTFEVADLRRYDMNAASNITAAGFLPVRGNNAFLATTGFGWQFVAGEFDRGGPNALLRDGHHGSDNAFRIQVEPGVTYSVRIFFNDNTVGHDNFEVTVEGAAPYIITALVPGVAQERTVDGVSADGILTIRFRNLPGGVDPNFVVNGIDIAEAGTPLPGDNQLADGAAAGPSAVTLTHEDLQPVIQAATTIWTAAGTDPALLARFAAEVFIITDLSAHGQLGLYIPGAEVILLDDDAGGHGWYLGLGPTSFWEQGLGSSFQAVAGSPADGRMDLLTVVLHELGHVLGLPDIDPSVDAHNLMTETLAAGVRRLPASVGVDVIDYVDQLFTVRPPVDDLAVAQILTGQDPSEPPAAVVSVVQKKEELSAALLQQASAGTSPAAPPVSVSVSGLTTVAAKRVDAADVFFQWLGKKGEKVL